MKKIFLLIGLLLWALPLSATMPLPSKSKPPSIASLREQAVSVSKVVCIDKRENVYSFKLEEVFKGNGKVGQTIDLKLYPFHFQVGQRYLLFLGERDGQNILIGGQYGKCWVKPEKGEEVIECPFGLLAPAVKPTGKGVGGEAQKEELLKKTLYKDFKSLLEQKSHD